jgi:hypothetical protein
MTPTPATEHQILTIRRTTLTHTQFKYEIPPLVSVSSFFLALLPSLLSFAFALAFLPLVLLPFLSLLPLLLLPVGFAIRRVVLTVPRLLLRKWLQLGSSRRTQLQLQVGLLLYPLALLSDPQHEHFLVGVGYFGEFCPVSFGTHRRVDDDIVVGGTPRPRHLKRKREVLVALLHPRTHVEVLRRSRDRRTGHLLLGALRPHVARGAAAAALAARRDRVSVHLEQHRLRRNPLN